MARRELFIERRTEEGDYAIRKPGSKKGSDVCDTQAKAIERAAEIDPNAAILVERVWNTDRGSATNGESRRSDVTASKQRAGQFRPA